MNDLPPALPPVDPDRVHPVREILVAARLVLEGVFPSVWVEGEVAGLKVHPTSGHCYFELRDPGAVLQMVMWRGTARFARRVLADGRRIRCRGRLTVWEGGGRFQMVVQQAVAAGEGDIAARLEELKRRLQAEGLTDPARRRPLPALPRGIGVATSVGGAALRDVLKVLSRRVAVPVVVAHCAVQGEGAPASIRGALARLGRRPGIDVVILTRGGGSAQDLAAFNDEEVARAVVACPVPVITAVGHEVDVTVVDLVADLRAATPSEAAERAAPTREAIREGLREDRRRLHLGLRLVLQGQYRRLETLERALPAPSDLFDPVRQRLDDGGERSRRALGARLERERRRLETVRRRILAAHPRWRLARDRGRFEDRVRALREAMRAGLREREEALARREARLREMMRERVSSARRRFGLAGARLDALSPLAVLGRGYALARDDGGRVLTDAAGVSVGDAVEVTLARGSLGCRVETTREGPDLPCNPR